MDKSKLQDTMGRPLTQSLFLELGYKTEFAIYTLKDDDYTYEGKVYPSLKRLYLEEKDPTEYTFACSNLLGWKHWLRLCANKIILKHIEEWREELEVKLRSEGIKKAFLSAEGGSFQAAKWLADRGWEARGAGRPSKEAVERETKMQARVKDDFAEDVAYLFGSAN